MTGSLRGAFASYVGPQEKPVIDASLLRKLAEVSALENQACARKVALAGAIWDSCIHQTVQVGEHLTDAGNYAASETAAVLGCSKTVADTFAEIGMDLRLRFPAVKEAFDSGEIDIARVRAIYRTTASLTADAADRVAGEVLHAARRLSPGPLATEIHAIIQRTAPEEAAENRKAIATNTRVRYRDRDILATIEADLEAGDAAACWQLITEMAATVCPRDPRTRAQRLAAAYIALMHREDCLACTCDNDADHPCTANPELPDRRQPLTTVTIDLETLAGLSDLPAYLAGHGLIDADYARELTENGTLQLLLTEARELADTLGVDVDRPNRNDIPADLDPDHDSNTSDDNCRDTAATANPTDSYVDGQDDAGGRGSDSDRNDITNDTTASTRNTGSTGSTGGTGKHMTFNPLGRGRRRRGLKFPKRRDSQPVAQSSSHSLAQSGEKYRGSFTLIAALERALAANPALAVALYPDGHGGFLEPPEGALSYRPSASLAECVRQRDRTCRHPGCDVPAASCEIDHVVPFLHRDRRKGGWTVLTNLHCLCRYHHSLKTMGAWTPTMLAGAVDYWVSSSGTKAVTLPGSTIGTADHAAESLIPHIPRKRRPTCTPDVAESDASSTDKEVSPKAEPVSPTDPNPSGHENPSPPAPEDVELGFSMGTSVGLTVGLSVAWNRVGTGDWAPF